MAGLDPAIHVLSANALLANQLPLHDHADVGVDLAANVVAVAVVLLPADGDRESDAATVAPVVAVPVVAAAGRVGVRGTADEAAGATARGRADGLRLSVELAGHRR